MSTVHEPYNIPESSVAVVVPSSSTLNISEPMKRKIDTQSQRDEERKREKARKDLADERREAREAAMAKEI